MVLNQVGQFICRGSVIEGGAVKDNLSIVFVWLVIHKIFEKLSCFPVSVP